MNFRPPLPSLPGFNSVRLEPAAVLSEVTHQTGQFGEPSSGREGRGKVPLMGIFCTLCAFNADASLHLSFNLLHYLLETI